MSLREGVAQRNAYPDFFAQKVRALTEKFRQSKTDNEKIETLGKLADYFYVYRLEKEGDSVLQKQMAIAELSQNKNLVLTILFENALTNISPWTESTVLDKTLQFIHKGLNYARELNRREYVGLAYIREANVLRKRGQNEVALEQAFKAFSALEHVKSDSIRVILYLEMGDIYLNKKESVQAYQNYGNAFDIAYSADNISLLSQCYHRFFSLYKYALGDEELAKENLRKSLELNKANHNLEGLLADYKDYARLTDNPLYIDSMLTLSNELEKSSFPGAEAYRLNGKNMMLAYHTVVTADAKSALHYFNQHPDLQFYTLNAGMPVYYLTLGNIYFYAKNYDSALHYYKLGEPGVELAFESGIKASIYKSIAKCHQLSNRFGPAIDYYQKALAFDNANTDVLLNLSTLYAQTADYEKAYTYNKQYDFYRDSLQKLNNQRELDLLEVDRENKLRQKELDALAAEQLKRRNIQYTGISLAIAFLFIALVFFGMFPISKTTIRMLNFFSFICLFEFIILLIDNWLHDLAHGEPLKIWLAKIFIIALLLPLHHTLEHVAIKFLSSQKLQRLRQKISVRRFFHPSKKTVEKIEDNLEESTLI